MAAKGRDGKVMKWSQPIFDFTKCLLFDQCAIYSPSTGRQLVRLQRCYVNQQTKARGTRERLLEFNLDLSRSGMVVVGKEDANLEDERMATIGHLGSWSL